MHRRTTAVLATAVTLIVLSGVALDRSPTVVHAGNVRARTTATRVSTSFSDGTACAASHKAYGISISAASADELAATGRSAAEVEAPFRSNPRVASNPDAVVHAYLAEVSGTSPVSGLAVNAGAISNRPVWVVEVSGLSMPRGGRIGLPGRPEPAPVILTDMQAFIDDATGAELFSVMCP